MRWGSCGPRRAVREDAQLERFLDQPNIRRPSERERAWSSLLPAALLTRSSELGLLLGQHQKILRARDGPC